MTEERIALISTIGYLVIAGIPLIGYLDKGRQSGKVTPKLCATLWALFFVGLPMFVISIVFWPGFTSSSFLLLGFSMLGFLLVWLAAYAGPMGIGWTGRWRHYVYPARKNKKEPPLTMAARVPAIPSRLSQLVHTWRFWTGIVVVSEIVIFIGGGLIFHNARLITIGIAVILIHLIAFLAIWYWGQKQLREKGWHW